MDSKLASNLVRDWIIKTWGPYMLPVEIPKNLAGSRSVIKFGTVHDLGRYSGGVGARKRLRRLAPLSLTLSRQRERGQEPFPAARDDRSSVKN